MRPIATVAVASSASRIQSVLTPSSATVIPRFAARCSFRSVRRPSSPAPPGSKPPTPVPKARSAASPGLNASDEAL